MFNKKKANKTQLMEVTCPTCGIILELAVEPGVGFVPCVCKAEIHINQEDQQAA